MMENTRASIWSWMSENIIMKMNDSNTEFIIYGYNNNNNKLIYGG